MGVIIEDSKIWECHEYNLKFRFEKQSYLLFGYDNKIDPIQYRSYGRTTALREYGTSNILIEADFIPISTGDDMHEEAWKLFHKLRELSIFT